MGNKPVKPDNLTIVHIGVMILMLTACAVCIGISIASAKGYYTDANANYVQEYATIVRYEEVYDRNGRRTYTTYYEYRTDDMIYSGIAQRLIKNEEEAKAQIGKKIKIYVDHTMKHHTPSLHTSTAPIWIASILAFVSFAVFVNSFVREIIFIVRWKKYKKELQMQSTN